MRDGCTMQERRNVMLKRNSGYLALCVIGLALTVFLAGCASESNQAILDLVPLQMQLLGEYGGSNAVVGLQDDSTLGVTIAEDASGSSESDLGMKKAREIAEFVCKHYGSIGRIDTVEVAFEIRRDGSVVDATGRVAYAFAPSELACSGP
jgi:hypothetical protein